MDPLKEMQRHYHDRSLAAKEWKSRGGKVVGYISHHVPEEMIIAAGLFPLRLTGDPVETTEVGDQTMEPFFDPAVRSIYHKLLTRQFDYVDLLVIPHASDSIFKMYYYLMEAKRIDPSLILPDLYLLDILYTRWLTTGLYNRGRIHDFKKKLEEISGEEILNKSLSSAISIVNENRMLLKKMCEMRNEILPRISGVEALQIIGSSMFMDKEEHNRLMKEFLGRACDLPSNQGVRISIEGSPTDNLQFYELAESCGAVVVGEGHSFGAPYADEPVDISLEPLEAITEKYHLRTPNYRSYPRVEGEEPCLRIARESKAKGVIFFLLEYDDMPAWKYPEQKRVLEDNSIPNLCFRMQRYGLSDTDATRLALKVFLEECGKTAHIL